MNSPPASQLRFADYFVVCGLDLAVGLEKNRFSENNACSPLEQSYKSKVLAHYPESTPWNPFDEDAVNMLCLPKGLQFRTQKHNLECSFHSFIITREDNSRVYGCALTFFEEVTNKNICTAMQTLQAMHLTDLSGGTINPCADSNGSSEDTESSNYSSSTRSLPRSFKLSSQDHTSVNKFYDFYRDKLYVSKAICLILQLPFIHASKQFLHSLHRLINSTEIILNIESYVYNILYEVPLPLLGRSIQFHCSDKHVHCQRPGPHELPMFEYSLRELFMYLSQEKVLQLYTCVLLENQIILYSKDYHKLMLIAEGITCLLFPFTWQHVYVPILPLSMMQFLDAPVPFIMGLHHGSEDRSQLRLPCEANLCLVDIDSSTVELPEDIPQFPKKNEIAEDLSKLMSKENIPVRKSSNPSGNLNDIERLWDYGRYGSVPRRRKSSLTLLDSKLSRTPLKSFGKKHHQILQQSEAVQKLATIAKRTGVISSLEDLEHMPKTEKLGSNHLYNEETEEHLYIRDLLFNNAVREIFLKQLLHLFGSYERFVIQPNQDLDLLVKRDQNFDKATYLSDQPNAYLPFLSRFLETQMFATMIDNKILSQWEEPDLNIKLFDARIICSDSVDTVSEYESLRTVADSDICIRKRANSIDYQAPVPQARSVVNKHNLKPGVFPLLDGHILNKECGRPRSQRKMSDHSWHKERLRKRLEQAVLYSNQQDDKKCLQESRAKNIKQPKLSEMTQAGIAQANWEFVEQLLRECKTKTKRMLVEKMGQEAVELGHGEGNIVGVEENTLIGAMCDLLERIWSHGLQVKQGKSALWSHLISYQEVQECHNYNKPISPSFLTPDLSNMSLEEDPTFPVDQIGDKKKLSKAYDTPGIKPLPVSLIFDMRNVQAMTDVKTDIGYARAWIRLSLEKKLLSKHLKVLLKDQKLLKSLYKRYAFLRYDDEKEQFLYHLLTLNAVDYFCFTNTFTTTIIPYRLVIFPSRKFSASTTTANVWVCVSGTICETGILPLPKQRLEYVFQHKNLGILTTLRIGHDNTGIAPKWMIEHILLRNEVTGHIFKFPCGRWLGKGVDDGSTERLLVGEIVSPSTDNEELVESCRTPPRCRSPSAPRRSCEVRFSLQELQQMMADAVNNIVKFHYKPERERGTLTVLVCGEMGLVFCLEKVFLYGFKSARLFGRQFYLWDFFVRVATYFESNLLEEENKKANHSSVDSHEHIQVMRSFCFMINKIQESSHAVGKDGKFQIFICLAAREHLLHRMMMHLATTPVTAQMYDENSFFRDSNLLMFLVQILEALNDFPIELESSLTKGISMQ